MFGYGALISDVRVSWPDGRTLDILQKTYSVGPWMSAGFSGSVVFGFQTIRDMQRNWQNAPEGQSWAPEIAAWRWHRRARTAWNRAPEEVRAIPSSVMLVGVSPFLPTGSPWPPVRCLRMRSPEFVPERTVGPAWRSIGSGASASLAEEFANARWNSETIFQYAQGERGRPGGMAFAMATSVALHLDRHPIASVSDQLVIRKVWAGRQDTERLHFERFDGGWSKFETTAVDGLAQSWAEFESMVGKSQFQASAAVA
jgi:hypothetical protein